MSVGVSSFLNLPLEIRLEVYAHALIQHQPEIPLRLKRSTFSPSRRTDDSIYTRRPEAFLITSTPLVLACVLALPQTCRQIRAEFSDFLRTAPVDLVTAVYNFDWSKTIDFLRSLPQWRRDQFLVREDGTAQFTLYIEMGGPYNSDWHSNLLNWVTFVGDSASDSKAELKTLHKTTKDVVTTGRRPLVSYGEVGHELSTAHQRQREGAGRLELDKIYYTLLAKYQAEIMLRRTCPPWQWDIVLDSLH